MHRIFDKTRSFSQCKKHDNLDFCVDFARYLATFSRWPAPGDAGLPAYRQGEFPFTENANFPAVQALRSGTGTARPSCGDHAFSPITGLLYHRFSRFSAQFSAPSRVLFFRITFVSDSVESRRIHTNSHESTGIMERVLSTGPHLHHISLFCNIICNTCIILQHYKFPHFIQSVY